MPSSRFLISSQTLGSAAASVTFSSIPATYTDLVLKVSGKTDAAGTYGANSTLIEFNNNSSAIYSTTDLFATWDGSSNAAYSSQWTGESYIRSRYTAELANPTSVFGSYEIYIPSYTASQNKPISAFGVTERNATGIDGINATAGLYRSTTAISQIKLSPQANWVSGSSFYLYGIKNS